MARTLEKECTSSRRKAHARKVSIKATAVVETPPQRTPREELSIFGWRIIEKPKGFKPRKATDVPKTNGTETVVIDYNAGFHREFAVHRVAHYNSMSLRFGWSRWAVFQEDDELAKILWKCEAEPLNTDRESGAHLHARRRWDTTDPIAISVSPDFPSFTYDPMRPIAEQAMEALRKHLATIEAKYGKRDCRSVARRKRCLKPAKGGAQ